MKNASHQNNSSGYKTAFQKNFQQALSPIEDFIKKEASSGIVLLLCAVAAICIANSPLLPWYDKLLHSYFVIGSGDFMLKYSIHHWINDGLMVIFFFVVGLEIKREILVGELADKRQAILPVAAALGGMVVPALIYAGFNQGEALKGWGIPMATDIAFALGVLALLGNRVPKTLVGFLLAVAIVDDLGAVLVIAFFYTDNIQFAALFFAAFCFLLLVILNQAGVRHPAPFGILGLLLWLGMLKSGVHATLAGVLTAMTVPARSAYAPDGFHSHMHTLLKGFKSACKPGQTIMENSEQQSYLQSMENSVHKMESPLQRMEHQLHSYVPFLVIPIFALANAGIPIDISQLGEILVHPVTLGVMAGLILGKTIGIMGAVMLVLKFNFSSLPKGISLSQIFGVSLLAAIGFTMSIFIDGLAFANHAEYLLNAKIGIVFASVFAGIGGFLWLRFSGKASQTDQE